MSRLVLNIGTAFSEHRDLGAIARVSSGAGVAPLDRGTCQSRAAQLGLLAPAPS